MRTVTVVGSSLAGFSAAQQLRAQGFDGALVMVGAEPHLPYDRPELSKGFLTGKIECTDLALGDQSDYDELQADWVLGDPAVRLRRGSASVELASGQQIHTDGVVIATGASPRALPSTDGISGVHTLRTVEDATALRERLITGSPRVVVIGAGFIGAEVASSCAALGLDVTLVEASELPMARTWGHRIAVACMDLHRNHGVSLRLGTSVDGISTDGHRVTGVRLSNGADLPADVVVVGIGVRPNTGWLTDSGLELHDGVSCDAGGVTDLPNIVAAGDVARVYRPELDRSVRTEHWTSATNQPRVAVHNLLAGRTLQHHADLPYFWSDQYGVRIQFAGSAQHDDDFHLVDGTIEDHCFLAHYQREGQLVGVLAFNQPRGFGRARRQLAKPHVASPTP